MAAHAKLGPSSAERWMNCTASVALLDDLAARGVINPRESSVYADEGTAAHELRQMCLEMALDPHGFVGMKIEVNGVDYEVTQEMADALLPGIDWIREFTDSPDVEIRVDLSPWLPDQFGTMDAGWLIGDRLFASDLKYGMGETVSPVANKQQMLYALGYWHFKGRPKVERVLINIDQPRAGGLKFWECSLDELLRFGEKVAAVYERLDGGDVEFKPTEKGCRWCKARDPIVAKGYTGCAAYNSWISSLFGDAFEALDAEEPTFTDPETLTPERRYYIVRHADLARKWLAALHEASLKAALAGNPDPGSKAVIGQRGNRYFTDEAEAASILTGALGDGAYKPRALIGITDAEKALKPGKKKPGHPEAWAALCELVDQPDGKPILVPAEDERPSVRTISDAFSDLDD